MKTDIVILAAGKGTRMRSKLPKVLHTLAGKAFLQHVIDTSSALQADNIMLVVGHGAEAVKANIQGNNLSFVEQTEQLGTGHAVMQTQDQLRDDAVVLILYGDVPLTQQDTLQGMLEKVTENSMALLTFNMDDPTGYGRIVRDENDHVVAIVEQKDATEVQQQISEVNTGVMAIWGQHLKQWLPKLSNNNAQGEYYLTDVIAMAKADGITIHTAQPQSEREITGINNRKQQAQLERVYQQAQAKQLMEQGLSLLDPSRFDLRGTLKHGQDCEIDINCLIEGKVSIGDGVKIGPNCVIKHAQIGDNVHIHANSIIEDATIDANCNIGPFARLRPGTALAESARIGNFVETKKAKIGQGSKVNHLSYVGDAEIGRNVNIGAGTITCNYDGVNKSLTEIGDEAFIGSNTALVAPVNIGKGATVGAGSTVTQSCEDNQLVVTRTKQRNIDGWQRPDKKNSQ